MWQKAFHIVLVTFLVIFSAAALVFVMSGVGALIFPAVSHRDSIVAYSGGLSISLFKVLGLLILFSSVLIVSLLARKRRLR